MSNEICNEILRLKEDGKSYKEIAKVLNVPLGTVKFEIFKKTHESHCLNCDKPFTNNKRHTRKFCSSKCRKDYWQKQQFKNNTHLTECPVCHKKFITFPSWHNRFCSQHCYSYWAKHKDEFNGSKN